MTSSFNGRFDLIVSINLFVTVDLIITGYVFQLEVQQKKSKMRRKELFRFMKQSHKMKLGPNFFSFAPFITKLASARSFQFDFVRFFLKSTIPNEKCVASVREAPTQKM